MAPLGVTALPLMQLFFIVAAVLLILDIPTLQIMVAAVCMVLPV
jgi:hypothetical protein